MVKYEVIDDKGHKICTIILPKLLELINEFGLKEEYNKAILEENTEDYIAKLDAKAMLNLFDKLLPKIEKLIEKWIEKNEKEKQIFLGKNWRKKLEKELNEYEKYNLIREYILKNRSKYICLTPKKS